MFNLPKFEETFIIDITNQLSTEMKTKTMTYAEKLREEGLLRGRQEGQQEGIQQGRQEGSLQSRYEFARKLLLRKMPLEEICELTDLTMEEMKRLLEDLTPKTY